MTKAQVRLLVYGIIASLLWSCSLFQLHADSASRYYAEGHAAESRNDILSAYLAYRKACKLRPQDLKFRVGYERTRPIAATEYVRIGEKLLAAQNPAAALAAFLNALDADPSNQLADADARRLESRLQKNDREEEVRVPSATESESPASPVRLIVAPGAPPMSLYMAEDSITVYQTIGKAAGINVLFDQEYVPKRIQIDLKDVTPLEGLDIVSQITGTFWKPITRNTIFVAQDTRAKRQTLGEQAVQIFYLRNVFQQNDLNDIQTALRNVLPTAKLYGVASGNAIVMRATPDELLLAKTLISGLDQPKPEVMVDITVMEVSRDRLRQIGLSPPTSLTVSSGSSQTLNQIGKASAYSIAVGQAAIDFLLTDSDTRILQNPRLRALDGQKASLRLGEKLPVATGSFALPTAASGGVAETQFQFLEVGVNVDMTPSIHGDRDVTLKLAVEISAQTNTETIGNVQEPVISQQKAEQVIRLKDGETSILAGLQKSMSSHTVSGWPGFGEIPLLKYFFTTQSRENSSDELVFLIAPHIVREPHFDPNVEREIDTGTESGVRLRESGIKNPPPNPAPQAKP